MFHGHVHTHTIFQLHCIHRLTCTVHDLYYISILLCILYYMHAIFLINHIGSVYLGVVYTQYCTCMCAFTMWSVHVAVKRMCMWDDSLTNPDLISGSIL